MEIGQVQLAKYICLFVCLCEYMPIMHVFIRLRDGICLFDCRCRALPQVQEIVYIPLSKFALAQWLTPSRSLFELFLRRCPLRPTRPSSTRRLLFDVQLHWLLWEQEDFILDTTILPQLVCLVWVVSGCRARLGRSSVKTKIFLTGLLISEWWNSCSYCDG